MENGWTPERRARQAELIRQWRPWEQSTGPKARSMREGINTLSSWCKAGAQVVSVTQQLDLSGPVGHLVAGVLFGIAEIERAHIRERQTAGITAAKQRGVYTGRKKGATKAPTGPEQAQELRTWG